MGQAWAWVWGGGAHGTGMGPRHVPEAIWAQEVVVTTLATAGIE